MYITDSVTNTLLLRPNYLHRQALSMDNPFYDNCTIFTPPSMRLSRQHSRRSGGSRESLEMELGSSAGVSGSQVSVISIYLTIVIKYFIIESNSYDP